MYAKLFFISFILISILFAMLLINCISLTVIKVDDMITEGHRNNLLIIYGVKE